ncbi:hypothetical protein GCM10009819_17010 [Agromyces tropicus]|uniref:Uncharacterized protein n=1 Tax=Agromyces tropicus TaxID=555371 RepID=A0ABN2UC12_9MICO
MSEAKPRKAASCRGWNAGVTGRFSQTSADRTTSGLQRNPLTATPDSGQRGRVIDRTMAPYLVGFVLCVGGVLGLGACTAGDDAADRRPAASVIRLHDAG